MGLGLEFVGFRVLVRDYPVAGLGLGVGAQGIGFSSGLCKVFGVLGLENVGFRV